MLYHNSYYYGCKSHYIMQQFLNFSNLWQSNITFMNYCQALSYYQMAITQLLTKLTSNTLLHDVQKRFLTQFIVESTEAFRQQLDNQVETKYPIYNNIKNYGQVLTTLNTSMYDKWQTATSNIANNLWKSDKNSTAINHIDLLGCFQQYNSAMLDSIQQNIAQMVNQNDDKETFKFLWQEFSKLYTHTPILNHEVIDEMQKTSCESLLRGTKMFLEDVQQSPDGYFIINTVDKSKFQLGQNLAATNGSVVYQNDLMQLICYESATENTYKTPIFIVAPWINKFYILDLNPQYSYVKWLVDKGYKVFITSWRNPDISMCNKSLADYMQNGVIEGIEQIKKLVGVNEVNCIGYCIGGTLLAITSAYLSSQNNKSIKSITLLTVLMDFEKCGAIKIFINDEILNAIEANMKKNGYISGHEMFSTFSAIKSTDMLWHYFINKYLLGKPVKAVDVLYWNADNTRIPYKLHTQCLRDLYQNNLLSKEKLILNEVKIDLKAIKCPVYCFSTQDDHIAPWESVYDSLMLCSGVANKRFILSKSGHVAAVINHPDKHKYGYWAVDDNKKTNITINSSQWFDKTSYKDGSWWGDWDQWMNASNLNGQLQTASKIPSENVIEAAPGSYVMVK